MDINSNICTINIYNTKKVEIRIMENILDKKEMDSLDSLNNRYKKLTEPGHLAKIGETSNKNCSKWNKNPSQRSWKFYFWTRALHTSYGTNF